jgi:hypothetical protein
MVDVFGDRPMFFTIFDPKNPYGCQTFSMTFDSKYV